MDNNSETPCACVDTTVKRNGFVAEHVCDSLPWGKGVIRPQTQSLSREAQEKLLECVLDSLQPVEESDYSACTDGRYPDYLFDEQTIIPVREQLSGADIVSAFYVAEMLGSDFYPEETMPVTERILYVAQFLKKNGIEPSSHTGCGAATNFAAIVRSGVELVDNSLYVARVKGLLPAGIFDESLHREVAERMQKHLASGVYDGLTADHFFDTAKDVGGLHGLEHLVDDGRGIHGHVEEQIIRIKADGIGLNEQKLAALSGNREVFAISDYRLQRLAKLFASGNQSIYAKTLIALEGFTDSTHATLVSGLPTYVVHRG